MRSDKDRTRTRARSWKKSHAPMVKRELSRVFLPVLKMKNTENSRTAPPTQPEPSVETEHQLVVPQARCLSGHHKAADCLKTIPF